MKIAEGKASKNPSPSTGQIEELVGQVGSGEKKSKRSFWDGLLGRKN